jgi:hypothetical protein
MTLDDVLKVVGNSSLTDFPWGRNVALLVNGFTPVDVNLKHDSTGQELKDAIDRVPEPNRTLLLNAQVYVDHVQDLMCANDPRLISVKSGHHVKKIIMVGFAGMLCSIAIVLTLSLTLTSPVSNAQGSSMTLKGALETIVEVIEIFKS